jgi:carbamoyltransferase
MTILGLNVFHGDASAAVLVDGSLIAAVEEERFNRVKHWAGFPAQAAESCLSGIDAVDHVAISRNPRAQFWRKVLRAITRPEDWRHTATRARNSWDVSRLGRGGFSLSGASRAQLHHVEHHRAHLASAFFASPFEEAAVLSIDGFGDFSSVMWGIGKGNKLHIRGATHYPHSLGIFYTAITQFLGFPKYGDEYKMMGLSAYGEPTFLSKMRTLVQTEEGQVRLNLEYFRHHQAGVPMTWNNCEPTLADVYSPRLHDAFGPARIPHTEVNSEHADLAASAQAVLEENYFAILNHVRRQTGLRKVCLAGGVALNCVANGMIFDRTPFQDVYIQPAAHDAGTSIGAALYVSHQVLNQPRREVMRHVYYGPEYSECQIREALDEVGLVPDRLDQDRLVAETARALTEGLIVGWFQGRMEFGPRALGARSILADPRRPDMKDILNQRIKFREHFRPFCPSIPAEATGDWFETSYPSPFMVQAYKIKPHQRARIPAVTHQDGTGRLQTVEKDVNPLYWKLLTAFGRQTGVPILINTSFNENEPIVNTPAQAINCYLRTNMDLLVIGSFLVRKAKVERCLAPSSSITTTIRTM